MPVTHTPMTPSSCYNLHTIVKCKTPDDKSKREESRWPCSVSKHNVKTLIPYTIQERDFHLTDSCMLSSALAIKDFYNNASVQ